MVARGKDFFVKRFANCKTTLELIETNQTFLSLYQNVNSVSRCLLLVYLLVILVYYFSVSFHFGLKEGDDANISNSVSLEK